MITNHPKFQKYPKNSDQFATTDLESILYSVKMDQNFVWNVQKSFILGILIFGSQKNTTTEKKNDLFIENSIRVNTLIKTNFPDFNCDGQSVKTKLSTFLKPE